MPAVSLISAVPRYVTKEERNVLNASTPSSFIDLPPILYHKEEGVSVTLDPTLEGFTADDAAHGTLYIISSVLVFMSNTERGFEVKYPDITLHAISRSNSKASIYCQLDEETNAAAERLSHTDLNGTANEEDEEGNDDYSPMRELCIIPQDSQALETIFEALSQCASLHPDPEDFDEDEDALIDPGVNADIFDGNEDEELSEVGRAALAHLDSIIYNPFEDSVQDGEKTQTGSRDGVSVEQDSAPTGEPQ
ncbi:hypothetical protein APHAL10511_007406 [Amanita phalloides]|nr:hypothetical protein APHAL10511_007406 [Amanita phalloides]